MSTLGQYSKLLTIFQAGYTYNEHAGILAVPSPGRITRLGGWYKMSIDPNHGAPYPAPASVRARLVVWDATSGAVLAQSADIWIAYDVDYTPLRYEADLTAPLTVVAGNYKVGVWHLTNAAAIHLSCASGGTFYSKAAGGSAPSSISGAGTDAYHLAVYAYFSPNVAPDKPLATQVWDSQLGAWVDISGGGKVIVP
jgi:hypothetical protein